MSSRQTVQRRRVRVLVSKLGLDGHDRGALVICRALRDAGMEVIYSGLFCTPNQVAKIAVEEDVDAVAMSLLNGAHYILLLGVCIIPEKDRKLLEKEGVMGNFGPGTPLADIIKYISENVVRRRIR